MYVGICSQVKMEDRVKFIHGQQKLFINYVLQKRKLNLKNLALKIKIPYNSLKYYRREKLLLPKNIFLEICKVGDIRPETLEVLYISGNWGRILGGKKGILSMRNRFPGKIREWASKGGKGHREKI